MRLVSLEVKGFKSFARETVLHFREDVTGVVGPNGSGKSNIVDAIRWVLGEQKRGELRLDKMSSVIFNGTATRKPGNVAQVFLTFDNDRGVLRSDFKTVTIGRLLYRNGDSEYRLNGVTCRRRDITDLFVDTGIESNSYAIIALGMVDDLLADKDNSRLRMLEQAAGISVYKTRKREALARLSRTREDLDRVEDLLHEVTQQLGALGKQARRAREYQALKATYRERSLDYAYVSSQRLRGERQRVAEELTRAEALAEAKSQELQALETALARASEEQLTEEQHLSEWRHRMSKLQSELRGAVADRRLVRQQLDYLTEQLAKARTQHDRASAERARLSGAYDTHADRVAQAEDEEAAYAKTLQDARAALRREEATAETVRTEARARAEALRAAEAELLATDKALAVAESRLGDLHRAAAARAREEGTAARAREALRDAAARSGAAAGALAEQLREAEDRASARASRERRLRDQLDALAPQLSETQAQHRRAEHEADLLQGVLDRLEGSSEADKYLGLQLGWRGRHPILGEVIEVEPSYRAAAESALADVLGSFVVPDAATAAEGLAALARAGKVATTVLYLDGLAADPPQQLTSAPELPVGATPLRSVIRVDERFDRLADELARDWYVVPDQGPWTPPGRLSFVRIDGGQRWGAWRARGGKALEGGGLQTGRRRRLRDLRAHVEGFAAQVAALDAQRQDTEGQLAQVKAGARGEELPALRRRLGEAEREAALADARLESAVQRDRDRALVAADDAEAVSDTEAKLQRLRLLRGPQLARRDELSTRRAGGAGDGRGDFAELAAASAAFNEANVRAVVLRNATAAAARERDYAAAQLAEVERLLGEHASTLEDGEGEVGALELRLGELATRIEAGEAARAEHATRLERRETAYLRSRDARAREERRLQELRRESTAADALAARLRERRAEIRFRLEALAERLRIEFDLGLDDAVAVPREVTMAPAELEAELARRKRRIDDYGEVNPLAVEAFEAVDERRATLTGQRDDVLGAVEDLGRVVEEIDASATERLLGAFAAVREHFVEVFRHLFDAGDAADMVMVDPERPLESRIEIVARPKGKRPQTIDQLSGGEKTLTATAFLFALYLIKPAPFCIFDEVDAPLDDSNVEKFNRIIKRFSGRSQFIIVTHNKLTMAAVDTIYGVFMPELGVSQVAPVDFRTFEHSALAELVG